MLTKKLNKRYLGVHWTIQFFYKFETVQNLKNGEKRLEEDKQTGFNPASNEELSEVSVQGRDRQKQCASYSRWQRTEGTRGRDWTRCPTRIHSPELGRRPHCSIQPHDLSRGEGQSSLTAQKLPPEHLSLRRERSLFLYNGHFRRPTVSMFQVLLQPRTRPFQLGAAVCGEGCRGAGPLQQIPLLTTGPSRRPPRQWLCLTRGAKIMVLSSIYWPSDFGSHVRCLSAFPSGENK